MNEQQIIDKLKEIFRLVIHNGVDLEKVTPQSSIMTDLGVNSIGLVYLVIAIEEMFDIDMSDVTFNTFKTIDDVVKYIQRKVK